MSAMQNAERLDLTEDSAANNEKVLEAEFAELSQTEPLLPASEASEKQEQAVKPTDLTQKNPKPTKPLVSRRLALIIAASLLAACLIILAIIFIAASLLYYLLPTKGEGNVRSQTINVNEFKEIEMKAKGEIILTQDSEYSVRVEAEDSILKQLAVKEQGSKLQIGQQRNIPFIWGRRLKNSEPIKYYISVKDLEEINTSGSGEVRAENLSLEKLTINSSGSSQVQLSGLKVNKLTIKASGSFKGQASGSASKQEISISGAGDYRGKELKTNETKVSISGSGAAEIFASEKLEIKISGAGTVKYAGSPKKLDQEISGAGKVNQVE